MARAADSRRSRRRRAEALGIDGIGIAQRIQTVLPGEQPGRVGGGVGGDGRPGALRPELQYDRLVRGEPVELHFYHDALGHPILDSPLALKAPEPGAQLELTIDSSIQSLAETELRRK